MLNYLCYHYGGGRLSVIFYSTLDESIEDCAIRMCYIYYWGISLIGRSLGAGGHNIGASSIFSSSIYIIDSILFYYYNLFSTGFGCFTARLDMLPELSKSNCGIGLSNTILIPPIPFIYGLLIEFFIIELC